MTSCSLRLALAASLLPLCASQGQSIAQRISAVQPGDVELHFAARPGVCGDGRNFIRLGRSMSMSQRDMWRGDNFVNCVPGPVRVRLRLIDGVVSDVHTFVGPARQGDAPATDLGVVPARDAAAYFLHLAATASGRTNDKAIMPSILADSASVWRGLLAVARDSESRAQGTRNNAAFWLSRFAATKLDGHGEDLAAVDEDDDDREKDDARSSAVFALSQLRNREGIPPLLQVARTNRDAHLRRQALFWLGQSGDARGLALFEEILAR
ncbi:MAG: HEAT repeat domain-containing protein [Gemmatimonadota bacterium]|nr:HEAT repeat domain-containing protein [Gemmatimonadota bacterium]